MENKIFYIAKAYWYRMFNLQGEFNFLYNKNGMKIFIENEAGSFNKNLYDEKSLTFQETIKVSRAYPYPYGFIIDTTGEDGDNIDAFVLTNRALKQGEIVEGEVIGLMEQLEYSWTENHTEKMEVDHNVLVVLQGEESEVVLTPSVKEKLKEFVLHVFDNVRENKTKVGAFLGKAAAENYIQKSLD